MQPTWGSVLGWLSKAFPSILTGPLFPGGPFVASDELAPAGPAKASRPARGRAVSPAPIRRRRAREVAMVVLMSVFMSLPLGFRGQLRAGAIRQKPSS